MVIGIDSSRAFVSDKTGTENYSYNLINEIVRLPESKQHTFVLFIRPNAILPHELSLYTNVKVKLIKYPFLWTQVGLALETWIGFPLDVLWVPAHTLPVLRNPSIKTVVTIHGLEYQWLPEYKNWLQKWYLPLSTFYAAKSATKLIAVSKFTAIQLEKELHTISEKIHVIHEGVQLLSHKVTPAGLHGVIERYSLIDKQYVLFVGTIQPRKNLVALIEAFSLFTSGNLRNRSDFKLVIAGALGWMAQDVMLAPKQFGVVDKVIFTGRVSDLELADLYLGALMYVQPSITEGFGLPVLEAFNSGVPVIVSDGGALSEVVGNAGIVVPLHSDFVGKLAEMMESLIENQQLRTKLIENGKNRVKQFSWEKAAKETLKVLTNL